MAHVSLAFAAWSFSLSPPDVIHLIPEMIRKITDKIIAIIIMIVMAFLKISPVYDRPD